MLEYQIIYYLHDLFYFRAWFLKSACWRMTVYSTLAECHTGALRRLCCPWQQTIHQQQRLPLDAQCTASVSHNSDLFLVLIDLLSLTSILQCTPHNLQILNMTNPSFTHHSTCPANINVLLTVFLKLSIWLPPLCTPYIWINSSFVDVIICLYFVAGDSVPLPPRLCPAL